MLVSRRVSRLNDMFASRRVGRLYTSPQIGEINQPTK